MGFNPTVRCGRAGEIWKGEERQQCALPHSHHGGNDRKKGIPLSATGITLSVVRCSNRQTQLTEVRGGGGRRGNLKHEMHSAVGQKTHGLFSCSKVPANGVVLAVGWQHEGG